MNSTSSVLGLIGSLLACVLLLASCGTTKDTSSQGGDMPSWFLDNRPMDPHHIFAAATATAPKLDLASSKATSQARGDIAAKIETRFEGLTKQFQEEVGQGADAESVSQFTQAYKSVVNRTINGSEVVKRKIKRENGGYRAYVLLRMPIGDAQETLMEKIQTQRNTYTRFQSSQAFKELEQEVNDHRQREKEQKARQQGQSSPQIEEQMQSLERQEQQTQPEQTTEEASDATVREREAERGESQDAGDAPTEDQVQAPESTEREAETGESRTDGEGPTRDQIEAPDEEADQPQGGSAEMSKAEKIESRVRNAANPWMGTPYSLGGETKNGVDCSALVRAIYEDAFSVGLPRTTGGQVDQGSAVDRSATPPSSLQSGDLIFFRTGEDAKHVGIYLDDRKFVHASSSQGVTVSPLKYDYWQNHYWQTRRFSLL